MGEHKLKIADVARGTGLHRNTITLLYKETASRVEVEMDIQIERTAEALDQGDRTGLRYVASIPRCKLSPAPTARVYARG